MLFQLHKISCNCHDCCILLIKHPKCICLWEEQAAVSVNGCIEWGSRRVCSSVFQDHIGAGMYLLLELQKKKKKSTKIGNAAPLSQCWLSVRGWGWHCSLQVSDVSLSKPVSPSDSPWGQGRQSLVHGSAAVLLPVLLPAFYLVICFSWKCLTWYIVWFHLWTFSLLFFRLR